jgi:tetratricopeptide (TPR) repeat protein
MNASDWYVLGNGYSQLKLFPDGIAAYRQCVRMAPRAGPAWTNLGVDLEESGKTRDALDAYQRAATLGDPLGREWADSRLYRQSPACIFERSQ